MKGTGRMMWLVAVLSVAVSGCMSEPELYTLNVGAANPADVHDTLEVDSGKAKIAVNAGGSGFAKVTVEDADGKVVFSRTFGSGGQQAEQTLSGASGTWTIDVDFTNWAGGFQIAMTGA